MSYFSRLTRTILAVIAIIDLAVFSDLVILTLISLVIGSAVIVLGLQYSFRSASIVGLLIVGTAAAASMSITTILEAGLLLGAISGLLIPMMLLTWICFSADEDQDQGSTISRREIAIALVFAGVVVTSAPLVSLMISFVLPTMTMRFTAATEIAIMMLALISGGMLLTREKGAAKSPGAEAKEGAQ
ncbi:MAG TPA: hypothetical protein VJ489_01850 [Thermoplasmata archaeon]|nr:hypothetical protein [Thermoplasmata archaeon]